MPGVLITTSQAVSAASPPSPVASTGRPPGPSVGGWSSTSTGSARGVAGLRRLACPSPPGPHPPAWTPFRSDQQIIGRIGIRDPVVAGRGEPRPDGGLVGRGELGGQRLQERGTRPVRPPGRQHRRRPALADLAHALERLARRRGPEQRPEPVGERGIGQRLPAAPHLPPAPPPPPPPPTPA